MSMTEGYATTWTVLCGKCSKKFPISQTVEYMGIDYCRQCLYGGKPSLSKMVRVPQGGVRSGG